MNTVNETGFQAGRYLYRTHEVRGVPEGGAVSVVDLETGETKILAQDPSYDALDGIRWTPWGTILFAEEIPGGRLLEIVLDPQDPMKALDVIDRPEVGRLAHEGIDVGPDGAVYVVDEFRGQREGFGGGIYKFVPDRRGDLSSGDLFALKVDGPGGIGQGEWVGPIDPANARVDGTAHGATGWNRPEDIEIIGDTLYVAVTEGTYAGGVQLFDGWVLAIDLSSLEVTAFVKPGVNVAVETSSATGFDNPDNLAESPDGDLIIVEDNIPSDIWFASKDLDNDGAADGVHLFASLSDPSAEGTGIYFGKDPHTMFVNVQHSANPDGDGTWAITNK
jgi:secreted PhoX family phosphatase